MDPTSAPGDASDPRLARIPATRWPTREEAAASTLFSAGRLAPIDRGPRSATRTRTWVPAMVPWRSVEEGFVTEDILDWYGRFADGQPGVLVVEATGIRDVRSGPLLRIGDDRFVPGLARLVERVRERSGGETRLLIQLIDFLSIRRRPEKAKYLERFLAITERHREALATIACFVDAARGSDAGVRAALLALPHERLLDVLSAREREDLELGHRERVTDVELAHVRDLPRTLPPLFAAAARRAREAGFDGVELHYAHAYTMASFLSRLNTRADGYGGGLAERVRLPIEVLRATRAEVGTDFVVGCRLLGDEAIEGGSTIEDACAHSLALARAGIDFVSVSKGGKFEDAKQPKVGEAIYPYTGPSGLECMPTVKIDARGPFGRNLPLSAAIRATLRADGLATPVCGAGGINSFELAERALREGACDFVAAARQSLADPDWWLKIERGQGELVRRCLYTNYCEALDQRHEQVTCQRWDRLFGSRVEGDPSDRIPLSRDGKRRLTAPRWT